jgi:hypothetical protein
MEPRKDWQRFPYYMALHESLTLVPVALFKRKAVNPTNPAEVVAPTTPAGHVTVTGVPVSMTDGGESVHSIDPVAEVKLSVTETFPEAGA